MEGLQEQEEIQRSQDGPFRVLCLDGGGVRGLYSAVLLQQLALRVARRRDRSPPAEFDVGAAFDLIVGTSTGSFIAAALVAGKSLERVANLYRKHARPIFQRPKPLSRPCLSDKAKLAAWLIGRRTTAANDPEPLRKALQSILGDETMGAVYRRRKVALVVPSVNAETSRAWVFKTPHLPRLTRDDNYQLVDVCMASAAAPIFFPVHGIKSPDQGTEAINWFVDGGLWANDPILVGLVEALEMTDGDRPIEIISVGTLSPPETLGLDSGSANRGIWGWFGGAKIVATSMEAQSFAFPYLALQIARATRRVQMYRLLDPSISANDAVHLGLDSCSSESMAVIERLAVQSVDINYARLTNPSTAASASSIVLGALANLQPCEDS